MHNITLDRSADLSFACNGAQLFAAALDAAALSVLDAALAPLPRHRPGVRLHGIAALVPLLSVEGALGAIAATVLGRHARPVRAVLFDKTPQANWPLGWHQDRTIAVRRKVDVAGFGPWSVKAGVPHVEPPFAVTAGMATLRLHLDPVGPDNAPLLIAPGSHRCGRVPAADIAAVVRQSGIVACLAEAGDAWLYATAILHASEAAAAPCRRRVLQVDYTNSTLPGGLEWLGI
jgi:ectoine hydroxylase-related dioxygenase (phytanoyl-CoA dioxygenase family)